MPSTNIYTLSNKTVLRRPLEPELAAPIRVVHQPLMVSAPAGSESHFQSVDSQTGAEGGGGLPADYVLGVGIDDERSGTPTQLGCGYRSDPLPIGDRAPKR